MRDQAGHVANTANEGEARSLVESKPSSEVAPSIPSVNGRVVPGDTTVAANYQYWREHGGEWAAEYDARKKDQVYYHIQEIMLTEYIRHHAPAKVLEFGCGPGRHLRNLSRLPGIEAFGYDQSAAMVSGARGWTSQEWLDKHVIIGMPTGRLPFADGQFDVVYTAEVLVHVRPEDLEGVLVELMRVARRQVFHLETSPQYKLVSNAHDGCWWHDLVAAYAKIGKSCETLVSGYSAHAPYRVRLDPSEATWEWSPVFLDLCRRMERDVSGTIDSLRGSLQGEEQARAKDVAFTRSRVQELEGVLAEARAQVARSESSKATAEHERREMAFKVSESHAEARAHAAIAEHESAARADLGAAARSLETELSAARARIAMMERELENQGQREADFIRAVERQSGRYGE